MAEPLYYKVTVKLPFTTANMVFVPGKTYWVDPDIYNSTLTDGSKFSSNCETVTETFSHP